MDIKHIKVTSADALYRISDKKAFKCLIVSCHHQTPPKPDSHPCILIIIIIMSPLPSSGDDSVLPAELFEGVLQGCGHYAVYTFQTARTKQLTQQPGQSHTRFVDFSGFTPCPWILMQSDFLQPSIYNQWSCPLVAISENCVLFFFFLNYWDHQSFEHVHM